MTTRVDSMPVPIVRRDRTPWLRFAMVFAACLILVDALFGDRGVGARLRAQREYLQATQDLQNVRNENAGLREQIRRLNSDRAAIEAVAREELGLIRPGEILFLVTAHNP